ERPSTQHRLQAAVLAALLGAARDQSLVVALPDGEIPFYNYAAADFLHWPFPPQTRNLAAARQSLPTYDLSGNRLCPEERPISRALATRSPIPEQEIVVYRDGVFASIITGATPHFDAHGEFIGVANYFRTTERDLIGFEEQRERARTRVASRCS